MVKVDRLTKRFGEFCAVSEVSFEVAKGETFALLGPNGSGKTTILKALAGLIKVSGGKISVNGSDLHSDPISARRNLSYLPQYLHFQDHLTAREVLEFFCRLRRLPFSRIDEVFNESNFDFNGFADRPVSQFSGGMQQRLGLAVACLPEAPVLLLDEPTASLDPHRAIQFREFLKGLKATGATIVFTSHVLADVEELADRVAILVEGRLVAVESIGSLRHGLARASQMSITLGPSAVDVRSIALSNGASAAELSGGVLTLTSQPEYRQQIVTSLCSQGIEVKQFSTHEPSIESIYLHYIRRESGKYEEHTD